MTREESIKLLALIKVAYPTAYKDIDAVTKKATVAMWHSSFAEVPYPIMEMAFSHFIKTSKFPPMVAEMIDEVKELHYRAFGDLAKARISGNEDAVKRCLYVIDGTEAYGGNRDEINYGVIPENLLVQAESKMLEGGGNE